MTFTPALMLRNSNCVIQIWTFFVVNRRSALAWRTGLPRIIDNGVFRLNADDILIVNLHVKTITGSAGLVVTTVIRSGSP